LDPKFITLIPTYSILHIEYLLELSLVHRSTSRIVKGHAHNLLDFLFFIFYFILFIRTMTTFSITSNDMLNL